MNKISDYKIAEAIIRTVCKSNGCQFVDLPVTFCAEEKENKLENGKIHVHDANHLCGMMLNVVLCYFGNFRQICGKELFPNKDEEQKKEIVIAITNYLRELSFREESFPEAKPTEPVSLKLYQLPFMWIVTHSLISPAFEKKTDNVRVIVSKMPRIDVSRFVVDEKDSPFVFVNADVEYEPLKYAAMLSSVIESQGLVARDTIDTILSSELRDKLMGLAKLAFKDDNEVDDFEKYLLIYSGEIGKIDGIVSGYSKKVAKSFATMKIGQMDGSDGLTSTWQYLGLIEKMIEPTRGSDWTTHKSLQPWLKATWDKIEKAREKAGREGCSYEKLLRVRSPETTDEKKLLNILERQLASDRVW